MIDINTAIIDNLIDSAYEHAVNTWDDDDIAVINRIINRTEADYRSPYTIFMSQDALADTITIAFYAGMKLYETKKKRSDIEDLEVPDRSEAEPF